MLCSTPTKSSEGDSQVFIGHVVARTTKTGSDRTARAGGREPGRGTGGHSWWGCVKIGEDKRKDLRRSDVLLFESHVVANLAAVRELTGSTRALPHTNRDEK
ncbi:hypothetical protein EVAR_27327_1 [Eumeta japonica]|uniref:Uncharacterized protein n=1 Tax=Eumeta variegata TaxID=151549 RepID=A0A4C1UC90_EUMVA|nr:hypothetical protein EVAR_27327_1 [Eumeta japonica]